MLLQIQTNFITYVTCVHADGPAHLSIIRVYIVCIDLADAQADLGVPYPHMLKGQFLFGAPQMIMGSAWRLLNISMYMCTTCTLIVLGFIDTSTLVVFQRKGE